MNLSWLDPVKPDERELAGLVALREAARAADTPFRVPQTTADQRGYLRHGWDGDPPLVAVATDGGRVVGTARLAFPRWDNTHLSAIDIVVDPLVRRRGLGRELLGVVADRACAAGRRLLVADPWDASPGPAFCTATGFERAYDETQREQRVLELDPERIAALRAEADRLSVDYELLLVDGATPDELLPAVAEVVGSINDAPTDTLDVEDEVFDADRIRLFEQVQIAQDRRLHRVLARHRRTGEPAGVTMVAIHAEQPWMASQYETTVAGRHRGHRLGLLLKLEMLRHLATAEPQLRSIFTWNADSNEHMLRVNELLGYRVVTTAGEWQRPL